MAMEKFIPKDKELSNFSQLDSLGNVSESDLWDAINDWLTNVNGEFNQLINAKINE